MITLVDPRFAAYVAVSTLLIVTPGPDTALVTRNALVAGRRAASATTAGIGLGSAVWAAASVLGVAVLLERSATTFTLFKVAGAAYLCFLGLRGLLAGVRVSYGRSAPPRATPLPATDNGRSAVAPGGLALAQGGSADLSPMRLNNRSAFRQGLTSNLLNPKAGAIFATVLPQFIQPGDSQVRLGLMLLAYEAILFAWLNLYGALVSRAGRSRAGARDRRRADCARHPPRLRAALITRGARPSGYAPRLPFPWRPSVSPRGSPSPRGRGGWGGKVRWECTLSGPRCQPHRRRHRPRLAHPPRRAAARSAAQRAPG